MYSFLLLNVHKAQLVKYYIIIIESQCYNIGPSLFYILYSIFRYESYKNIITVVCYQYERRFYVNCYGNYSYSEYITLQYFHGNVI